MVDYARGHQLQWIEDESNQNTAFSRNYVRHQVIPVLKARWPQAVKQLAKTAIHCQEAQSNLADLAHLDMDVTITSELDLNAMTFLPRGRLINALRFWFKKNQVKAPSVKQMDVIVDEVVGARGDAKAKFEGGSYVVRRFKNRLYLESNLTKKAPCRCIWDAFPQELCMEGMTIKAMRLRQGFGFYVPNGAHIDVRFRQNGEQLVYLQHMKSLKKILQSLDIAPWKRQEVPLVYINDKLAVVGRYVIADEFYKNAAEFAVYELCYD